MHMPSTPSRSGVAKERKVFMDLMRNEIDRVNTVLAKSEGGSRGGFPWEGNSYDVSDRVIVAGVWAAYCVVVSITVQQLMVVRAATYHNKSDSGTVFC